MIENISTNEFMFFKNEVLSEFKKIEQKFTKILEEQNQEIIKKYNISEQRVKLLQDKLFDFSSVIENNKKLSLELNPLFEMKKKFDETILMLQTKIDSIDRDLQTSLYKYDSLFNNGFLVPGLIGPSCKFNSVKNFLEYSNKILTDYSTFKSKQTIDLKSYKDKLENIIQSFKLQNENMNNTFLNHCKKILKENKENFEERVKLTEDKLETLRIENNKCSNDFMYFKNEVLSEFKKIEQNFKKTIEEQNQEIIKKYNISEQRVKLLQDKLFDFSSVIENNKKLTLELKPLFEMKNKFDETILTLKTKIDSIDKNIQNSLSKYESLFNKGFLVPGLIGPSCKYPSIKNFLEYSNKILSDYSTFKNKQTIDLKGYKDKLENLIQSFKLQNENMNNTFINHCKKILKENKESFEVRVKDKKEKIDTLRIENNKYSNELIETTKQLNIEWDKLNIFKKEVNKRLENNESKVEEFHQDMINKFQISKNDNLLIKQKFINLSEFIKDVRFRRNIGIPVRTKEFKDMSKNIDFTRKQKLKDDYKNEININDDIYNELLLKLKDEFSANDIKKNDNISVKSNTKIDNEKEIIIINNDNISVKSNIKSENEKDIISKKNDNISVK